MTDTVQASIISAFEAESYVESLECLKIEEIGSPRWITLHERLESLNMQALLEAQGQKEEYVKDLIISRDKLAFLVKDLIMTEVWRDKILPEILSQNKKPKTSIGIYVVMHHEVTVLSLLEVMTFRFQSSVKPDSAVEALGDLVLDVIDYCHRALVNLLAHPDIRLEKDETAAEPPIEVQLGRQRDSLRFMAAVQSITLLQHICEQLSRLTVSAASRLLRQHDLPLLLVQLLDARPWLRTNRAGRRQKYERRQWVASPPDDLAVAKIEGQLWLTLLYILMDREHLALYEISEYRRGQLLRLQKHLTDTVLEQVPPLGALRQWLAHISVSPPPPPARSGVIIETVPELRQALLDRHAGRWAKLARQQLERHFRTDLASIQEQARRLAAVYDLDKMAPLMAESTRCAACGEVAVKKCSRCKAAWYCGRQCQVKHWPVHKPDCDAA
ncbi:zinc finger MYND domain-containing protein 10-like [Amphibalanus amphitrite]|uniref:zinc finger MYND domain-containing protein 10-like n=1 Tax=Amphibalanus amphitrite TaxID=1232801 RepID=UPI001C9172AB|nr:zinc finger MYND domain-containing protein 10-like [Amphibalanus amphitrite]